jgi:leucyl-tRNA synthetase
VATTSGHSQYDPSAIEQAWQGRWAADRLSEINVELPSRKFYNLVEFPYPSAEGLHVGHAYTYSGADTYGRYLRMQGRSVFQPIGFDSFGIHTENYAIKVGEHPRRLTERTIANYRRQLTSLGAAWDWSREIVTSDASYYRWTQWIFVKLYQSRSGRSTGGASGLVSILSHRARERAARGRSVRTVRDVGRAADHAPMVPTDHRVRLRAA